MKYTASFTYRKKTETVSFRDPGRIRSYIGILDSLFSQDGPGFGDQFQVLRAGEKQAVFSAILGVSQPVFSEADRKKLKNDAEKFALLIGRLIVEKCVGEFEKNRTIQELVARGDGLMKIDAPQLQEELQKALDRAREKVNETMARYLNRAEHEVAKVVDTANRLALSGNVGVSVSEAKGAFGGGIMASAMWGPHVQTGAYVNAQFSESMPDSGKPAKSLVGLLVRVAGDAVQADGAVSILFGQGRFKAFETWELGAALSYRAHEHFILGVAYFGLFSSGNQADFRTVHTLATTFKGASPGSPSLLLGRLYTQAPGTNRAVRRWIYQMSFPIPAYR